MPVQSAIESAGLVAELVLADAATLLLIAAGLVAGLALAAASPSQELGPSV